MTKTQRRTTLHSRQTYDYKHFIILWQLNTYKGFNWTHPGFLYTYEVRTLSNMCKKNPEVSSIKSFVGIQLPQNYEMLIILGLPPMQCWGVLLCASWANAQNYEMLVILGSLWDDDLISFKMILCTDNGDKKATSLILCGPNPNKYLGCGYKGLVFFVEIMVE